MFKWPRGDDPVRQAMADLIRKAGEPQWATEEKLIPGQAAVEIKGDAVVVSFGGHTIRRLEMSETAARRLAAEINRKAVRLARLREADKVCFSPGSPCASGSCCASPLC